MAPQQSAPAYAQPPSFSPPSMRPRSFDQAKSEIMDLESERNQRAASVLSGLSADDLEAAETLKSLGQDIHSPRTQHAPPSHVQTRTFKSREDEPVLSLITSQYPLAASVINSSISVYKTAQQYTPGGEWTERNLGLPLARKATRISGLETVTRWALQPRKESRNGQLPSADIEKAVFDITPDGPVVRQPDLANGEILPAYSAGDRSPPYSEHVELSRQQHPGMGWRQQLVITTSGLSIAMSDDSIKTLRFCLTWVKWANGRLGDAISNLKDLLQQWDRRSSQGSQRMSVSSLTINESDESVLHARIAAVKKDVLDTLKQVVGVISTYAGGALPENARRLVHQHLVTLPQRFSIAQRRTSDEESHDAATASANRALVLAQEGLDMMTQVSRVVNDTLVSAENWCEKLGRRRRQPEGESAPQFAEKPELADRERSTTVGRDEDVKMEM